MQYRKDIDGLRAVAVLPVVLYHLNRNVVSGGFVGVDVFFVISGYLITTILLTDLRAGTYSIVRFYERRARRILPALGLVMAAVLTAACLLLLPDEFEDLSRSAIATAFFVSNVFFTREAPYFEDAAEVAPLLHTWSLAVEEQFYILFPMALALLWRFKHRLLVPGLTLATVASFALSVWASETHPKGAFYLSPFRMWELGLGALLAAGAVPAFRAAWLREVAAGAGLALIGWSAFAYSTTTTFPGLAALVPCLGAALLIEAGRHESTLIGRILSLPPLVFIGLISYSLYLWHWPLIVFFKLLALRDPAPLEIGALFLASTALAGLTWRFVETPARRNGALLSGRRLLVSATVAGSLVLLACGLILASGGLPARMPVEARRYLEAERHWGAREHACFERRRAPAMAEPCLLGPAGAPKVLLTGDSHAEALAPGLEWLAARHGATIAHRGRELCPPVANITTIFRTRDEACGRITAELVDYVRRHDIRHIVLAARWNLYTEGWIGTPIFDIYLQDPASRERSYAENARVLARNLGDTIAQLTDEGREVWLVLQPPAHGFHVTKELARAAMPLGLSGSVRGTSLADHRRRSSTFAAILAPLRADPHLHIVDPTALFCDAERCEIVSEAGDPLFVDSDHLSPEGARRVAGLLEETLDDSSFGTTHAPPARPRDRSAGLTRPAAAANENQ